MGKLNKYATPDSDLTQRIARYGFKDDVGIDDVIGMAHGGWMNDQ